MADMAEFFTKFDPNGKKEVTFYEVSKISFWDLQQMITREFPGKPYKDLKIGLGIVNCTVSEK